MLGEREKRKQKERKKQLPVKNNQSNTTMRCIIRKRTRWHFQQHGETTYLIPWIHCTRHYKIMDAFHVPAITCKKKKKNNKKRWNHPCNISLFFFLNERVKRSYSQYCKKNKGIKTLAYFFLNLGGK